MQKLWADLVSFFQTDVGEVPQEVVWRAAVLVTEISVANSNLILYFMYCNHFPKCKYQAY